MSLLCLLKTKKSNDTEKISVPSFLIRRLELGRTYDVRNLKPDECFYPPVSTNIRQSNSSRSAGAFLRSKTLVTDLAKHVFGVPPCIVYEYLRQMQLHRKTNEKLFFDNIDGMFCYYTYKIKQKIKTKYKSDRPMVSVISKGLWYLVLLPPDKTYGESADIVSKRIQDNIAHSDYLFFQKARFLVNSVVAYDIEDFLERISQTNTTILCNVKTEVYTNELFQADGCILDDYYFYIQNWKNGFQEVQQESCIKQNRNIHLNFLKTPFSEIKNEDYAIFRQTIQNISSLSKKSLMAAFELTHVDDTKQLNQNMHHKDYPMADVNTIVASVPVPQDPKQSSVKIPQRVTVVLKWVFQSDTKDIPKTLSHIAITFSNTYYTIYFVTFDHKKVINPGEVNAEEFRKREYLLIRTNKKIQMLACHLCKKLLQINREGTFVQCYCGTYLADRGYRYHTDILNAQPRITENIKYDGEVPEYKVILVGASGKGKSTLINGLASYSKHNTLKEAESNEMVPIIPINFRLLKKFKQYPVHIKTDTPDDDNEDFRGGGVRSTTQKPKRHLFNLPGAMPDKLTFIDTPGINDTRGHKMDDQNIEYIKRALIEAQYVHAVCFVLSANDIKMITSYETVLRRLLSLVPKDALKNVVFFFNSTRGTNYGIGDSIEPLMCIFKNLANYGYNVHFVDDNVFFFENDCFRYLCAAKCGHAYSQNISFEEFEESWEVNRKSYRRFVHYLSMLEPVNGASFDRLDLASKWLDKFKEAFNTEKCNNEQSNQIVTLIHVLEDEESLSVDEQLVLYNQLAWLLNAFVPSELCDSIQSYRDLRLIAK